MKTFLEWLEHDSGVSVSQGMKPQQPSQNFNDFDPKIREGILANMQNGMTCLIKIQNTVSQSGLDDASLKLSQCGYQIRQIYEYLVGVEMPSGRGISVDKRTLPELTRYFGHFMDNLSQWTIRINEKKLSDTFQDIKHQVLSLAH